MGKSQSREALTRHQQSPNIAVPQMSEQLRDLVNWQPFAIFLEGITQPDIETIVSNNPLNVDNQRNALFSLWLRRCPNPSWDHVITALDKAREHTLAQRIREYAAKCKHNQPQPQHAIMPSPVTVYQDEAIERTQKRGRHGGILAYSQPYLSLVTVDEDTVKTLAELKNAFCNLFADFQDELTNRIEMNIVTLDKLISRLQAEKATYNFQELTSIKCLNDYFEVIFPHSTFLDCHLLVTLAERFLNSNSKALEGLHNHQRRISALKRDVKIENLKSILHSFITVKLPNQTAITIKAQQAWAKNELHAVEVLLQTLFPFEHQRKLFRVVPGSVCIVYLVPHHITESLITHSQHKKEFMRLTGIISLQIGETYVLQASEENKQFTFEMGLMEAVETKNNEAVKYLLEHTHTNINIQTLGNNGGLGTITDTEKEIEQTPETTENQFSKTKIQAGIIVAMGSGEGKKSNKENLVDLFKFDSNRNMVWRRDPAGTTPLMIACINDDTDMIQLLLEHNANTNIQTRTGWTALMYAARQGNTRTIELLLKHNAEVNTIRKSNGATALIYACAVGNANSVIALLNHGADYERKMDGGATSLFITSQVGHSEVVERILRAKANPDIPMDDGATPLYIASQNGHSKVVGRLLQAKANPNIRKDTGATPLFIASQKGHSEVVERLLQANANPNTRRNDGSAPLYVACQNGHTQVVEKLLQAKATPDIPRDNGATPLHAACYNGYLEIVKMLLQAKANPNYLMNDGRSLLYLASLKGHTDIVKLLERYY